MSTDYPVNPLLVALVVLVWVAITVGVIFIENWLRKHK